MANKKKVKVLNETQREYKNTFLKGYRDPDSFVTRKYNKCFYSEYWKAIKEKGKKHGIDFQFNFDAKKTSEYGIQMVINNEGKTIQLKSDQFGFSIPDGKFKHPYYIYYSKAVNASDRENAITNISKYREITRLVGGSFLWPIEEKGKRKYVNNPPYNYYRGGSVKIGNIKYGSYIQDRVDLTLYEIKEVYEFLNGNKTKDDLKGNILMKYSGETTNMYKFLKKFGNFKTFVDVFGFYGNFVSKDLKVVNIFKTKDSSEYIDDDYIKDARDDKKLFTEETDYKDFERMFNLIVNLIEDRRKELGIIGGGR